MQARGYKTQTENAPTRVNGQAEGTVCECSTEAWPDIMNSSMDCMQNSLVTLRAGGTARSSRPDQYNNKPGYAGAGNVRFALCNAGHASSMIEACYEM